MLSELAARGETLGARRTEIVIDQLVARARDELPGIGVAATRDGVVLSARGLWRRLLGDARLRWIGGLWR